MILPISGNPTLNQQEMEASQPVTYIQVFKDVFSKPLKMDPKVVPWVVGGILVLSLGVAAAGIVPMILYGAPFFPLLVVVVAFSSGTVGGTIGKWSVMTYRYLQQRDHITGHPLNIRDEGTQTDLCECKLPKFASKKEIYPWEILASLEK